MLLLVIVLACLVILEALFLVGGYVLVRELQETVQSLEKRSYHPSGLSGPVRLEPNSAARTITGRS